MYKIVSMIINLSPKPPYNELDNYWLSSKSCRFFLANVFKNEFSFLLSKCIVHQVGVIEIYLRSKYILIYIWNIDIRVINLITEMIWKTFDQTFWPVISAKWQFFILEASCKLSLYPIAGTWAENMNILKICFATFNLTSLVNNQKHVFDWTNFLHTIW